MTEGIKKLMTEGIKKFISLSVLIALMATFTSSPVLADDDGKDKPSAKPVTTPVTAIEAPVPLTERERRLLERVEQLEKRMAELEAKGQPAAPSSGEAAAPQPSAVVPATAQPSVGGAPASGEVASAVSSTAVSAAPGTAEQTSTKPEKAEPFAFADFTWMNGNARTKQPAMDTKFFTPEIRVDAGYVYDFNHPKDDTIGGSAEVFRAQEFNLTQLGVGGDFHFDNVRARMMTQFGMYSQTQPRNDASPTRGQWGLDGAYKYLAEAYGGYHFNAMHGINVDAGIFMSYIGLFSWYNFDNWAYQPSYVSSNTPFFFNGLRAQFFPTAKLKIEPWLINGWQSYGRFNNRLGFGFQVAYRPTGSIAIVSNGYMLGEDTLNVPGRIRYHSDSSIQIKYYDRPENFLDKMAFSLTGDIGCEHGGGVSCAGGFAKGPKQSFLGFMLYNRMWFANDKYGLTLGGGKINNPGRYLVLIPPINGATAATGTPYFTANPGDPFKAWDASATFDWMPSQYITFRTEFDHRAANVPYFSGAGGITPTSCPSAPLVSNICGTPGSFVPGFTPDLRKIENRIDLSILVKF
jgi:Putative beta-barrel porin-2, OmpL-like. bbp2